jgi:tRNA threonylcarbamoyladenosine biosynthesis protein TsaB
MKILALDHASEHCSVALCLDGDVAGREARATRDHGAALLAMAQELLDEAGIVLAGLDAIALGRGPGAFTGLRLAASVAQGLAFSADLGVIPVSDLRALAQRGLSGATAPARVLACQDARMGEVYWAGFGAIAGRARAETPEAVERPETMAPRALQWIGSGAAGGAGSGFSAFPELAALAARLHPLDSGLRPRAHEVALLAAHDGYAAVVAPEHAVPVYLRNDVAAVPSRASTVE